MIGSKPDTAWLFSDPEHGPINTDLTKFERRMAVELAKERQAFCKVNGVKDQKKARGLDGQEITIEGTAAEMAFAKVFNLHMDMTTGEFFRYDFILPSTLRTDIKQSEHKKGNLVVKEATRRDGSDLFVLVLGKGRRFQIWGYTWGLDLLCRSNMAMWLPVPGFLMRRADLLDPRDLFNPDPIALQARRLAVKTVKVAQARQLGNCTSLAPA